MIADPAMSRLREWVIEEGEPLASSLQEPSDAPGLGSLVAEGERTSADAGEYALVLEAIREGCDALIFATGATSTARKT